MLGQLLLLLLIPIRATAPSFIAASIATAAAPSFAAAFIAASIAISVVAAAAVVVVVVVVVAAAAADLTVAIAAAAVAAAAAVFHFRQTHLLDPNRHVILSSSSSLPLPLRLRREHGRHRRLAVLLLLFDGGGVAGPKQGGQVRLHSPLGLAAGGQHRRAVQSSFFKKKTNCQFYSIFIYGDSRQVK